MVNATYCPCGQGCGYNDGRERVNDAWEVVTQSCRSENPFGWEGIVSWISWNCEAEVNVNRTDGDAEGAGMGSLRATVLDCGPHALDWDSYSCSYPGFCFGCVVGVLGVGLRSVFDSSRGRNLPYDHRPWAWRGEAEVAYHLLDPLALFVSCLPRDASVYLSPSSRLPTSLFELAISPVPLLASSLFQPSQRSASVCFLPAFRGQKPRLRRNQGVAFLERRPCGPIRPVLQRLDHVCHEV